MSSRILALVIAVAASSGMASAMSAPVRPCHVIGGEKLPASTGGPAGICAAVERAMASKAPKLQYSVEVRVLSPSALSATIVAKGRTLPKQDFAVSDRNLNPGAIERFAQAIAEVVKAG